MHYRDGCLDEARDLVTRYHYSHRVPGNIQGCYTMHEDGGLFGDFGPAVAALFFSIPPTRWSEDVWELSRLVRDDHPRPLTQLISFACKAAKTAGGDLLVSFADWTQEHHGGIYQAASWHYAGKRGRRVDGCIVDGQFIPGRSCNSRWGTRSPTKLAQKLGRPVSPHYDEGKHLYWRALTKAGKRKATRLGLDDFVYPKPNRCSFNGVAA